MLQRQDRSTEPARKSLSFPYHKMHLFVGITVLPFCRIPSTVRMHAGPVAAPLQSPSRPVRGICILGHMASHMVCLRMLM